MENVNLYIKQIGNIFGKDAQIELIQLKSLSLLYRNNFQIYRIVDSANVVHVVIFPLFRNLPNEMLIGIYNLLKQKYKNVYIYMIDEQINFEINYITQSGKLILSDNSSAYDKSMLLHKTDNSVYTKHTQLVAKFYFFNEIKNFTTSEIANKIKVSPSTVARSNIFLHRIGVLNKFIIGPYASYRLTSKGNLLSKLDDYFIRPYNRTYNIAIDKNHLDIIKNSLLSGESALSKYSNLLEPLNKITIAEEKEKAVDLVSKYSKYRINRPDCICEIQSFIYDPTLFKKDNCIDIFDLYIIVKFSSYSNDPRINAALLELKRKMINGK